MQNLDLLQVLQVDLILSCKQIDPPLHSIHLDLTLLCKQIWLPKQSLQVVFSFSWIQNLDPSQSLHEFLTLLWIHIDEPLEVRFFGDGPDSDDVFQIKQDNKAKGFRVFTLQGKDYKINALLEEFGLAHSQNP